MAKSVGAEIQSQKRSFEEALKSNLYSDAQNKIFKDAISSLEYISAFYEGRYVLPNLETDAASEWGTTHGWLMGSYVNVYKAQTILDGKEQPVKKETLKSNGCNCEGCNLAMQNESLLVAVKKLKTETFSINVKRILNNILQVLLRYKCESATFLINRTKDVKAMLYNSDGFLGCREIYKSERVALDMLIAEFEQFLK